MRIYVNSLNEAIQLDEAFLHGPHQYIVIGSNPKWKKNEVKNPPKVIDYQGKKWYKIANYSRTDNFFLVCLAIKTLILTTLSLGSALIFPSVRKDWSSVFKWKEARSIYGDERILQLFKERFPNAFPNVPPVAAIPIKEEKRELELEREDIPPLVQPIPIKEEKRELEGVNQEIIPEKLIEDLVQEKQELESPVEKQETPLSPVSMHDLPPEIQTEMLRFLPVCDLASLSAVSTHWKGLISQDPPLSEALLAYRKKVQEMRKDARRLLEDVIDQVSFSPLPWWNLLKEDRFFFDNDFSFLLLLDEFKNYHVFRDKYNECQWMFRNCHFPDKEDHTANDYFQKKQFHRKIQLEFSCWRLGINLNKDDCSRLITIQQRDEGISEDQKCYAKQLEICLNFIAESAWKLHCESDEFKNDLKINKRYNKFRWNWVKSFSEYLTDNKDLIKVYLSDRRDSDLVKQTHLFQKKRVEQMDALMNSL